jgi:hypothetical protein
MPGQKVDDPKAYDLRQGLELLAQFFQLRHLCSCLPGSATMLADSWSPRKLHLISAPLFVFAIGMVMV